MKLGLDPPDNWRADGRILECGSLTVAELQPGEAPAGAGSSRGTLQTRGGWVLEVVEHHDGELVTVIASLELCGERAALVARGPLEDFAARRTALLELLETARPWWPDTVLLCDLLELPEVG